MFKVPDDYPPIESLQSGEEFGCLAEFAYGTVGEGPACWLFLLIDKEGRLGVFRSRVGIVPKEGKITVP